MARIVHEYGSLEVYLEHLYPTRLLTVAKEVLELEYDANDYTSVAMISLWPWLTVMALFVFRKSLRRVRINSMHVLRCSVYSFDFLFWAACAIFFAAPRRYFFFLPPSSLFLTLLIEVGPFVAFLLGLTIVSYRLAVAFKHYLRLDKPVSVVVATQVIVILVMANIYALFVLWLFPPPVA